MRFQELRQHLKQARLPCYVVYGEDKFLTDSALAAFKGLVTGFPEFNISYFAPEASAQSIAEACEILPVMSEVRLVIAERGEKDKDKKETDRLKKCAGEIPESCVLVLWFRPEYGKPDLLKALEGIAEPVDCSRADLGIIKKWAAKECAGAGREMTEGAAELLAEYCGRYLTRMSCELKKLCSAGSGLITEDSVRELVTPALEYKVYELGDALAKRDGDKAMQMLETLLAARQEPTAIISAVAQYFRRLLFCSLQKGGNSELAQLLGVKEYAVTMASRNAALFTPVKLKKINDFCHEADSGIKSGKISAENAVNLICLKVLNI